MSLAESWLASPRVYSLWQAPFRRAKMRPVLQTGDAERARRVLDVACGPGIDTAFFRHADYTGIDLSAAYVRHAQRQHPAARFICADARRPLPGSAPFDLVLVNSLLHHLCDDDARAVLENVAGHLSDDGAVHVLDLVLPDQPSVARWLARHDRGSFPRAASEWRALLGSVFETVRFEPYAIRGLGIDLWHMVHFTGSARRAR